MERFNGSGKKAFLWTVNTFTLNIRSQFRTRDWKSKIPSSISNNIISLKWVQFITSLHPTQTFKTVPASSIILSLLFLCSRSTCQECQIYYCWLFPLIMYIIMTAHTLCTLCTFCNKVVLKFLSFPWHNKKLNAYSRAHVLCMYIDTFMSLCLDLTMKWILFFCKLLFSLSVFFF